MGPLSKGQHGGRRVAPKDQDRRFSTVDLQAFKKRVNEMKAEGIPVYQIAYTLGVSPSTLAARLRRAR